MMVDEMVIIFISHNLTSYVIICLITYHLIDHFGRYGKMSSDLERTRGWMNERDGGGRGRGGDGGGRR